MNPPLFTCLSTKIIAQHISQARERVCFAAPGIHAKAADALVNLKSMHPGISVAVSLDFDERTLRMGYGSLGAVKRLRESGIHPMHSPGFRSAVLIVDDHGWIFTPTAHYLESEPQSEETPNAIRLSGHQINEILLRLSPAARD